MNYCKILTYFALVEGKVELVSDEGVTYRANDWDAIERLHDSMTDAEIDELNGILDDASEFYDTLFMIPIDVKYDGGWKL